MNFELGDGRLFTNVVQELSDIIELPDYSSLKEDHLFIEARTYAMIRLRQEHPVYRT